MTDKQTARLDFATLRRVPKGVWALGFVSLFMDISSEMIHALLPVYLVATMGTSMVTVGFIEGIAEAIASIVKVFSGAFSDWLGKRKGLAVAGYGLAAITKPVFPLAASVGWIVAARWIDRIGKGIRGAPRDALVADITPSDLRGASFGLRQSLDTVGAFTGPALAIVAMWAFANDIRLVFWLAIIPAALSVLLLVFGVEEPDSPPDRRKVRAPLALAEIRRLGGAYWLVTGVAGVFALARFSEAFLVLKAHSIGLALALVPAVLIVMNVAYAMAAYPAGVISDNGSRIRVLGVGVVLLIAADLVLALAPGMAGFVLGVVLWGLHMGFSQGLLASLVADTAPPELRGTAYGILNLLTGVALLMASVIAGALWDTVGPSGTFLAGAAFALLVLIGLLPLSRALGETAG